MLDAGTVLYVCMGGYALYMDHGAFLSSMRRFGGAWWTIGCDELRLVLYLIYIRLQHGTGGGGAEGSWD